MKKNIPGIELIAKKRQQQIDKGYNSDYDRLKNKFGQLSYAASILAPTDCTSISAFTPLNWDYKLWTNLCELPYSERLIEAGAFIAAELDRINKVNYKKCNNIF